MKYVLYLHQWGELKRRVGPVPCNFKIAYYDLMFTRIGLLGAGTVWENSYLGRATPLHTSERERERDIFTWDSDCGPLCVPPPHRAAAPQPSTNSDLSLSLLSTGRLLRLTATNEDWIVTIFFYWDPQPQSYIETLLLFENYSIPAVLRKVSLVAPVVWNTPLSEHQQLIKL